jgi:ABC-2 type transport system permease protein
MRKTLLIGSREFQQRVTSRGFLLGAIAMPLVLLAVMIFGGGLAAAGQGEPAFQEVLEAEQPDKPIGYVDRAGVINTIPQPVPTGAFRPYGDEISARAALNSGEIAAYYVMPNDYRSRGEVERVSPRFPTAPQDTDTFEWVLLSNLFLDAGAEEVKRLRWPFDGGGPNFISVEAEEGTGGSGTGNRMLPFVVTIAVVVPLFTGGSYLFQSLTQEKGNRVMEILLVSLRPRQLLTGKLLGFGALVLVEYAVWIAIAALALVVARQDAEQLLARISLSANEVFLIVPYALGGFSLYAALMAGIGALSEDMESSGGWVFVLTLPMMAPVYLWTAIASAPNGPLAVALSLFPYSAPVAMVMRMTASVVPAWQLGVSLALVALATAMTIWLMARLFRAQTLLSGESLSLNRFWTALRSGAS